MSSTSHTNEMRELPISQLTLTSAVFGRREGDQDGDEHDDRDRLRMEPHLEGDAAETVSPCFDCAYRRSRLRHMSGIRNPGRVNRQIGSVARSRACGAILSGSKEQSEHVLRATREDRRDPLSSS